MIILCPLGAIPLVPWRHPLPFLCSNLWFPALSLLYPGAITTPDNPSRSLAWLTASLECFFFVGAAILRASPHFLLLVNPSQFSQVNPLVRRLVTGLSGWFSFVGFFLKCVWCLSVSCCEGYLNFFCSLQCLLFGKGLGATPLPVRCDTFDWHYSLCTLVQSPFLIMYITFLCACCHSMLFNVFLVLDYFSRLFHILYSYVDFWMERVIFYCLVYFGSVFIFL